MREALLRAQEMRAHNTLAARCSPRGSRGARASIPRRQSRESPRASRRRKNCRKTHAFIFHTGQQKSTSLSKMAKAGYAGPNMRASLQKEFPNHPLTNKENKDYIKALFLLDEEFNIELISGVTHTPAKKRFTIDLLKSAYLDHGFAFRYFLVVFIKPSPYRPMAIVHVYNHTSFDLGCTTKFTLQLCP